MPRTPRSAQPPVRFPDPWLPVLAPARGPTAVAMYLRAHLYGAAVGRSVLDRCISAVDPEDRVRLVPLRREFEEEIDTASRRHTLDGFGPALTHSAAWLLLRMGEPVAARAVVQDVDTADATGGGLVLREECRVGPVKGVSQHLRPRIVLRGRQMFQ